MTPPTLPYHTALVTGASRGIGAAICHRLATMGLQVHAVARDAQRLQALSDATGAVAHRVDVTDLAAVARLFETLDVDVLVNNAGLISALGSLETLSAEDIDQMIAVNLRTPLQLIRLALPGMLRRKRGHIINLGSTAGTYTFPGTAPYAATKAGMSAANRVLRHDLVGSNIRITEISPGRVHTTIYAEALADDPDKFHKLYDDFRTVQPEDIANAVATVLAMPEAVDVSFMEVVPTDQAPGGHAYARANLRKD